MPTQVQFRRGTTAQNQNFTGAAGEISIDTSKKTLVVHDGSTAGGFPLAPNTAFDVANAAFASANTVDISAPYDVANAAFGKANSANVLAYNTGIGANAYAVVVGDSANNYAGAMANAANAYAASLTPDLSPAFNKANDAYTRANTASGYANQAGTIANSAFLGANNSYTFGNTVYAAVNSVFGVANAAYAQANTLKTSANAYADVVGTSANNYAGLMANAANAYAASLTPDLSPAYNVANAAFNKANSANVLAYNTGIGANAYATVVGTSGNAYATVVGTSANAYSNATFVKLTASSQTITGDLSITGNLTFLGNATSIVTSELKVGDSLIYLAANNYSGTDLLDIGFIANYGNTTGQNVHTGLVRDATNKQYYLFQGYDVEPANNTFVPGTNNMVNAVLVADINTSNLTLGAANAIVWIKSSYDNSNSAYDKVNTVATSVNAYANVVGTAGNAYAVVVGTSGNAYATAVGTAGNAYAVSVGTSGNNYAASVGTSSNNYAGVMSNSVNSYTSATYSTLTQFGSVFGVANGAFNAANGKVSSVTGTAGQIFVSGTTAPTLNLITTGVSATTYGGATQIPVITVDAYGRLTSASNVAVNGMDYTFTNTKVYSVSSNSTTRVWANTVTDGAGLKSVYIDLSTSGVTATTYGGATQIPVLTVDAYGRITGASNVSVSGMDYAYVNTSTAASNTYAASVGTSTNNYTSATYATKASPTFTGTVTMNANISNQTLTDGVTISWDVSLGQVATVTLGGNRTVAAPTNLKIGTYILHVIQDATGSRTLTWNAVFKWPAGVAPTLTTTANARDVFSFISDGTNLYGTYVPDVK